MTVPVSDALRARFIGAERTLAANPGNDHAREMLLDLFIAAGMPADLPGASLPWPTGRVAPAVAVITPYGDEPSAVLARCVASVRAQAVPVVHFLIADGVAREIVDTWGVNHIRLPARHRDSGDTPRRVGGPAALDAGCTAVAYLDADNTWRPRHLESLLACHARTGAAVCHSARTLHGTDGSLLPLLEAGDNVAHVDTSCLLVTGPALAHVTRWASWPHPLSPIGDRLFWAGLVAAGHPAACTGAFTMAYTADRGPFYVALGRTPPPDARPAANHAGLVAWYDALDAPARAELDRAQGFPVAPIIDARRKGRRMVA